MNIVTKYRELDQKIKEPSKMSKLLKVLIAVFLVFDLLMIALFMIPYEREVRGLQNEIHNARTFVDLGSDTKEFYFLSVKTNNTKNLAQWINAKLRFREFQSEEIQYDIPVTAEELTKISKISYDDMISNIIIVLHNYLNKPLTYSVAPTISVVFTNMENADLFREGDKILAINNKQIQKKQDIVFPNESEYLTIQLEREQKIIDVSIPFDQILPFVVKNEFTFHEGEPFMEVILNQDVNYNGNSAGLIFTLDLIQQITGEDLTKGYKIAGTGALDSNGDVQSIGSVDYKIMSANLNDCDIVFVPKGENEIEAMETYEKLNSGMKMVSVATLQEAIEYLRALTPRNQ